MKQKKRQPITYAFYINALKWHQKCYKPNLSVDSIIGDVSMETEDVGEARKKLENLEQGMELVIIMMKIPITMPYMSM